jgi:hypothetical protein
MMSLQPGTTALRAGDKAVLDRTVSLAYPSFTR